MLFTKKKFESIKIGFWSALIASLCCLGSLFLVLLGISTISTAIGIGYYKPYFFAAGIVFFVASLAYYLKKKKALICEGCSSKREEKYRLISVILLAAATFVVVYGLIIYFIVPQIAPVIYQKGNITKTLPLVVSSSKDGLLKVNLKIEGVTCASCTAGIENVLENLSGVSEAEIEYPQRSWLVVYNPQLITIEEIIDAIKPYKAIVVE